MFESTRTAQEVQESNKERSSIALNQLTACVRVREMTVAGQVTSQPRPTPPDPLLATKNSTQVKMGACECATWQQ